MGERHVSSSGQRIKSSPSLQKLLDWDDWQNDSDTSDGYDVYMSAEERTVLTDRVKGETTTVPKAFFNFTVCILASALLSMPYGFDNSGILGGAVLLVIVGVFVDYTLLLLGDSCMKLDIYDYQQLAEHSFGKKGRYFQAGVQLILSLSLMVSYQIISAQNIINLLKPEWLTSADNSGINLQIVLVLLCAILIIVPLATLATLKLLGYSSMISVAAIAVLTIALLYFDIKKPGDPVDVVSANMMTGVSVFATGFVCHQIVTPTLDTLEDDNKSKKQKFHLVVHMAIGASIFFFCSVGAMGYIVCNKQGEVCSGNILENATIKSDFFGSVAIVMFLICVLFAYPLEHFSCTNTITKLMYGEWGQPPFALGLGIKLALVAFTTVPALFISDIGPLISWAGNLAAFPLGLVLPLAISLKNRDRGITASRMQTGIQYTLLVICIGLMSFQIFTGLAVLYYPLITDDSSNLTFTGET